MTKSDAQVTADRDDAEMMKRGHLWPNVRLPLMRKSGDGFGEPGMLMNPGPPWIVVAGTTIFGTPGRREPKEIEYVSAEAIVADGWTVD